MQVFHKVHIKIEEKKKRKKVSNFLLLNRLKKLEIVQMTMLR